MNIVEFLEPVIEKRTEEIMDEVLKGETGDNYKQYIGLLQSLDSELRNELENYYLNSLQEAVRVSYEKGILEASKMRKQL
ncbi:hypothetical protein D3C73_886060 [compost metagenome]